MKINVLTLDKKIISFDFDHHELVGNIKASLNLQQNELLYNGKEMKNDDKLSEVGVQEEDLIVVVSDSAGSSPIERAHNPDESTMNFTSFQPEIRQESNMGVPFVQECSTNLDNVQGNDDGDISAPFLAEKETSSHLLDEEGHPGQESVGGNSDVNGEVNIQRNGSSTLAEEDDHDHRHVFNSNQKAGYGDHNDSKHYTSSEYTKANVLLASNSKGTEVGNSELFDSSSSPSMVNLNPAQTTKGHGLKKWRRIRRDSTKDSISNLDSTKLLKRGQASILDVKEQNDGSVSSTNAFVKSPGEPGWFSNPAPSLNCGLALDTTFSAGADDSEDRSSKSSTAASAPKHKHDVVKPPGHQREKHRAKNTSGRHLNNTGQRSQLDKGHAQADTSKKPRGEVISVDNENSLSSLESDSRSYTSVLQKGCSSVNSDQIRSGRSANFYEQDAYDEQACELQSSDEHQVDHCKYSNLSPTCSIELSSNANIGDSKDHQLSRDCEPLLNSILLLQSAQEALQREVQMFKEIGKGIDSLCGDSGKETNGFANSMYEGSVNRDYGWNAEVNYDQTLEKQLDEAKVKLHEKELKITELEMAIKGRNMESSHGVIEMERNKRLEMEAELEGIFKLKLEAEVQYVAMTGSTKDLTVQVLDEIKNLRDQTFEARERQQSLQLTGDVGNTHIIPQGQSQKENIPIDITDGEEIQKMRSWMVKFGAYLFIQLLLLLLVLGLFLLRVLPKSATVVPT